MAMLPLKALGDRLRSLLGNGAQNAPLPEHDRPPGSASGWFEDGLALLAAGDRATLEHRLATEGDRHDRAEWLCLYGAAASARGDFSAAIEHLQAAVAARADFAPAHNVLGAALQRAGRPEEALASFKRAVESKHDDVDALVGQAEAHIALGHPEDAADCFELALAFAPDHVSALVGLGKLHREAGNCDAALRLLERATHDAPHSAEVWFELGQTHKHRGSAPAALSSYERALEIDAGHFAACVNAGMIHLSQLGDAPSAQRYFERAAALQPDSVAAQANFGLALFEQGQVEAALAHYEKLIAAYPDIVEYRWNRGLAQLSLGNFAAGWHDYELRSARGSNSVGLRRYEFPEWDGNDRGEHHVLVYAEQGLGDEVMFAGCVPDLLRLVKGVVLECDERLASLFQRSFPSAVVHGAKRDADRAWLSAYPEIDCQIAIGSLPGFFRRRTQDFPPHQGYLIANPERTDAWRSRLAEHDGKVNVGLSWRGGTRATREALRSLTFDQCLSWLTIPSLRFVCLQRGDCAKEVAAAKQLAIDLDWWPSALQDTDELAALIAALDLVITVPSTVAHLAGALGRPLWIPLSPSPEWRYLWQGERMPWYPSARLFRQSRSRDWESVIAEVRRELAASPSLERGS